MFFVFFSSNLSSTGCSHVGSLISKEEQKKVDSGQIGKFHHSFQLVHDITDIHAYCWAQNHNVHCCVFTSFRHQVLMYRLRNVLKNC